MSRKGKQAYMVRAMYQRVYEDYIAHKLHRNEAKLRRWKDQFIRKELENDEQLLQEKN